MSKIIRTEKPSALPFYAAAAAGLALCAALPVYKMWALAVALAGAAAAFAAARRVCPPQVIEREVPFHTGDGDVDEMLTGIQKQLDTLRALNDALPDPQLSAAMDRMEKAGRSIIEVVEQAPAFPGGPQAMRKFIKDNLQYPQIAKENGIQGRVILQFVVDETGQVTDPKVVRSIDPSLDAEAIRLVNSMPRWTPGMQDGKTVSVRYTVPVAFSLNEDGALPRQKSVWVIDEKVVSYEEVKALPPSDIAEMRVLKGEQAIKKYGDQAKDGAIEITTKAAAEAEGQLVVNGQVVDEKGEPIVGAIVQRTDGSGKGVVTDTEGRFSLKTPKGARLECMYVGFETVRADAQPEMKITLKAE